MPKHPLKSLVPSWFTPLTEALSARTGDQNLIFRGRYRTILLSFSPEAAANLPLVLHQFLRWLLVNQRYGIISLLTPAQQKLAGKIAVHLLKMGNGRKIPRRSLDAALHAATKEVAASFGSPAITAVFFTAARCPDDAAKYAADALGNSGGTAAKKKVYIAQALQLLHLLSAAAGRRQCAWKRTR
ncbi:hypothetical protein HY491_02285 [Candidatus Woesearchaeota archaeon]|nr:hypothetical protein [Candidatus Woesearchaeota archaeon]